MRVSVAMASWNAAPYVAEAVRSVLDQLGADDELVVVDDGSTDQTREILASFGDRLRLHLAPHRGVSASRNASLDACGGRFQGFVDADDRWAPGSLAHLVGHLEASPDVDVVVGLADEFLDVGVVDPCAVGLRAPQQGVRGWFLGSMLARRAVFDQARFDETQPMAVTSDWLAKARDIDVVFAHCDEVVLERRIRPGSLTTDTDEYAQALLHSLRAGLARRRSRS